MSTDVMSADVMNPAAVGESLWRPRSACDVGCLPTGYPPVAGGTAVLRVVGLMGVLLGGVLLVPVLAVLRGTVRSGLVRALARAALAVLGIRVSVRGRSPRPGSLLVADHVSWLDVVVLLAATPARLIAKREVRDWPAVGVLGAASGSLFVDRSRPRRLPTTVAEVAAALRAGDSVAVFPEGTTSCGVAAQSWRPAMFQAAVDAGALVVPVAIAYQADGEATQATAFVGDDSLWASICRIAGLRRPAVSLVWAPPLHPAAGADRRSLARAAQATVRLNGPSRRDLTCSSPRDLGLAA